MQFPILIELHRSRLLSLLLVVLHVLAMVCGMILPWTWEIRALLVVAIGVSGGYAAQPNEILALRLSEREGVECAVADGDRIAATVLPSSTVFNRLIVLRLRLGERGTTTNLALLPDSMSAEAFRVLSLWLRWQAGTSDGADV